MSRKVARQIDPAQNINSTSFAMNKVFLSEENKHLVQWINRLVSAKIRFNFLSIFQDLESCGEFFAAHAEMSRQQIR